MDEITSGAKDVYYSAEAGKIGAKYIPSTIKRFSKKMTGKDKATQALMARSYSMALQVVARLDGIEFYEVAMSVFVFL